MLLILIFAVDAWPIIYAGKGKFELMDIILIFGRWCEHSYEYYDHDYNYIKKKNRKTYYFLKNPEIHDQIDFYCLGECYVANNIKVN